MTEKMIRDAYCKIRTIDQTIPDDILDFMKDVAIEKLNEVNKNFVLADVSGQVCSHPDKYFVSGVFGGYWCPKCDRNVDADCEQTLR